MINDGTQHPREYICIFLLIQLTVKIETVLKTDTAQIFSF